MLLSGAYARIEKSDLFSIRYWRDMIESGSLTWKTASIHINVVAPINAAVIPRLILPAQPESAAREPLRCVP
jgi:hypothetical protein